MCAQLLQLHLTLCNSMECGHQASLSIDFSGKNIGVGCHALLQGIFPTQGSNLCLPHLLHCRRILYPLSHLGSPLILHNKNYIFFKSTSTFPTPPNPWLPPILPSFSMKLTTLDIHLSRNMQYLSCDWLISLTIMFSGFIHAVAYGRFHYILRLNNIPLYMCLYAYVCIIFFTPSSINQYLCHFYILKVKELVIQSCPIPCDPMDSSMPGSSVHGISQARILEWVAISFSKGSSQPRDCTQVSCIAGSVFTICSISWLL